MSIVFEREKPSSKYVAFYAVHNRISELELNVKCFNRSEFLKQNFDVVVNCNCESVSQQILNISKLFDCKKLIVQIDPKNEGGYMMGPMEQAANSYHHFFEYDLVMQLHADVYLMRDFAVKNFVLEYEKASFEDRCDFYAFPMPNRYNEFAYDFWFMKPSQKANIFKCWKEVREKNQPTPNDPMRTQGEAYLFDMVESMNLKMGFFDRGPHAGMHETYENSSGILHTKNFSIASRTFEELA